MSEFAYAAAPEPPRYWHDRFHWNEFLALPSKIWPTDDFEDRSNYPARLWAQCGVVRAFLDDEDDLAEVLRQTWKSAAQRGGSNDPLLADNIRQLISLSTQAAIWANTYPSQGNRRYVQMLYLRASELYDYLQLPPDPDPMESLDPSESDSGSSESDLSSDVSDSD